VTVDDPPALLDRLIGMVAGALGGIAVPDASWAELAEALTTGGETALVECLARARDDPAAWAALLMAVRQARLMQAAGEVAGTLEEVEASGPWATPLPAEEAAALVESLSPWAPRRDRERRWQHPGPADLRLIGPLMAALADEETAELAAVQGLPAFGVAAVPDLCRDTPAEDDYAAACRFVALCRLDPWLARETFGPAAGRQLLLTALRKGTRPLRLLALGCLPAVAPAEECLREAIAHFRQEQEPAFRWAALDVLKQLGPAAAPALPLLLRSLRLSTDAIRARVAPVVGALGPAAVAPLLKLLKDYDARVRLWALRAARAMADQASTLLPAVVAALEDEHPQVRAEAARARQALGRLNP
jgi:hypothetical protein